MNIVTAGWIYIVLSAVTCVSATSAATLDIYFIDVEGGQATLVVTPQKETLLVDTGHAGDGQFTSMPGDPALARDPQRILAAAKNAGVEAIDYLLITHFHADHAAGVTELSQLLPIRNFVDHDGILPEAERLAPGTQRNFEAYVRGEQELREEIAGCIARGIRIHRWGMRG